MKEEDVDRLIISRDYSPYTVEMTLEMWLRNALLVGGRLLVQTLSDLKAFTGKIFASVRVGKSRSTSLIAPHRPILTEREAADYLGMSLRMLQERRRKGKIWATRVGRYRIQYTQDQLDTYVAECRTNGDQGSSVKRVTRRRGHRIKQISEPLEGSRKGLGITPHHAGSMFRGIARMTWGGSADQSNVTKPDN